MWKKILTMSLALVMVLSLTACDEETEEEVELPSVQEIVDGVIESLDEIRTYKLDMDATTDMAGDVMGEALEVNIVTDFDGTVDLENRQMRMDVTMNTEVLGEDEITRGVEMYLIGAMAYMLTEAPEMPPAWVKSEIPEVLWKQMSQVESQIELLEAAQVDLIGSEKVGGIDCWVLQVTLDMDQLWQFFMQQTGATWVEMPDVAEEFLQEMFRSFSVKQWIAKDTYFLTKAETDMAVELTPEAMGAMGEEGEMTIDLNMSWLVYDYNQPVSIVLPPGAEDAIEVPME